MKYHPKWRKEVREKQEVAKTRAEDKAQENKSVVGSEIEAGVKEANSESHSGIYQTRRQNIAF